jgi:FSR family fosmidomycin resistance protein-like MFS transporter
LEQSAAKEKQEERRFDHGLVGASAATHFGADFYGSFFSPLLPLLVDKYSISLGLVGVLATMRSLTGSFTQPIFGYLADVRIRGGLLVVGVLASAIFMSTLPMVPNLGWLVVFLLLAGLGISMSHPVAASLASKVGGNRRGLSMSIYMTGGSFGFALGPFVVAQVADRFGLEKVPYLALFGVGLAVAIFISSRNISVAVNEERVPGLGGIFSGRGWSVVVLLAIVTLRATVSLSFGTYLPLYLTQRGTSLVLAGLAVSAFRLAGTAGGLIGGPLSDRMGRRRILFWSSLGAIPFLWLSLQTSHALGFVFLGAAAIVVGLASPAQVLIAHELAPQSIGTASGLSIGFAWGLAGFSTTLVGFLGQAIGLGPALSLVVVTSLLVASLLARVLGAISRQALREQPG